MLEDKVISRSSEWTFELLKRYNQEIGRIAKSFGLDTYPNQIEVINAEQMIDLYSSVGMPLGYHHWSFGKQFMSVEKNYRRGHMGLAYELVINSNPCIAYLMEENSMMMQALVIAHACYGHNSFFKNNYLFKQWTNADLIVDYLVFAKNFVSQCEERYGLEAVEDILDSAHALMNYGVDRYQHPSKQSLKQELERQARNEEYQQSQVNILWRTLPNKEKPEAIHAEGHFPPEPQENILYFLEKHAPLLESWQRELIRIVRKIAQYFYPQRQTKVMNEGWATFWHYTLINAMYEEGLVGDEFMLEFLQTHTNVIAQPGFDHPYYSGINPYALGFAMMTDIKRICQHPTEEDRIWFPNLVGTDWVSALDFAMRNFKDESFIAQYLSPKLIRDLKLFAILDDDQQQQYQVSAIHDEAGYQRIREALSLQYNLSCIDPNIQVYHMDHRGDRSLTLCHVPYRRQPLEISDASAVLRHLYRLWGFPVRIDSLDENGSVLSSLTMPPKQ